MAKRKKHRKKKQAKQTAPVAKAQVTQQNEVSEPVKEVKQSKKPTTNEVEIAEAGSAKEASLVKIDVRFGLILVGIIAIVFVVLYLLLQNPTVSAKIYGLIKLPNIGN